MNMKEQYNLSAIVALCLENEVSFKLSYGENKSKRVPTIRAAMAIDLVPAVNIEFGDSKHGTLVSRIHVANNHKLTVRVDELIKQIKESSIKPIWNTSSTIIKHSSVTHNGLTAGVGTGTTGATGVINSDPEVLTDENGTVWGCFELLVPNIVHNATFDQSHELAPTRLQVSYKYDDAALALAAIKNQVVGMKIYAEGEFIYPRKLIAVTMGGAN
jgi:hypothetical protein